MYYGGFSLFWVIVFAVAVIYLNGKINRLASRLDKAEKKEPVRPSAPATAPSLADIASSFSVESGTAPTAPAVVGPLEKALTTDDAFKTKVDGEEKGGQWLGKIGVAAIVLGASFFLRWAFDNNLIGPMGRVMLGVIGGMTFVVIGQFLRKKYLVYSDIVTGGGIAILYLSIFAAFAFYHFIGQEIAMVLMFFVTTLSVTLSVIGGTQQLAVLGIIGGFLTPVLVSTGENNFGGLMSYLVVLDIGILIVAIFKKWTRLNLLGFIGTVLLSFGWFANFYAAKDLPKVFLVLTLFFVIYLIAGIVHNVLWKKQSKGEDLFLITCTAAFYALGSYTILNPDYHSVMGFFMFFLSVFYFAIAYVAYRMNPEDKTLNLYLPGIAIVFLTLAMPIQFSGKWITLAWLIEAALLIGAGSLVRRHSMNVFGLIVFGIGLIRLFMFDMYIPDISTYLPVFNSRFFLTLVAIIVAYFTGFMFLQHLGDGDDKGRKEGAIAFFVIANLLSLFILTSEINAHYAKSIQNEQKRFGIERTGFYDNGGGELSERTQNEFRQKEDAFYKAQRSTQNRRNTVVSIAWAFYAVALTAVGFGAKRRLMRLLGLALFFITAFKVLIDVWALGEVYRIISSISFGVIALLVSFVYAKWRHRLQEVL
ncbi:MAG: DUF2339 domain-containing protein [Candidatus Taylorbacteria bacterium]|nr:DUF2339 domain-containing protein [Candidatus Taylorbacteria bacterium]